MKSLSRQSIACVSLFFASSIVVGCNFPPFTEDRDRPASPIGVSPSPSLPSVGAGPNYVAQVVQQVGPTVVRVDSTRRIEQPQFQDPFFERFYGGQIPSRERVQRGTGSGVITDANGLILTNAHVVANADAVSVVLKDGRRLEGQVVGADPITDIAVVKVNATNLPAARLGNSDNLVPGQAAIAIGNPLGLSNTVTEGIISATGRSASEVGAPAERVEFIQTDAAINPGNSGGPLLNAQGEVIGINTAIIQGAQGLGFAVPINTARRAAEQLVAKGRVDHPYIGVRLADLDPALQAEINRSNLGFTVNQQDGVIILSVAPGSPASQAGMRPGDVIESINGQVIQRARQVQQVLESSGLGQPLQIIINRNGQNQTLNVRPQQLPSPQRS